MRPDESRAVLIGVAEYPDDGAFDSVEGASYNVLRLKDLLTDPAYAGFHRKREYTRTMLNPHTADGIRVAVKRAAEQATDVLFVYYVGHGSRVGAERELYLTTCTTASGESVETTGLRYTVLRGLLRAARARVVVLVLDCCFSGIATKVLGHEAPVEEALAEDELLDQDRVAEDVDEGLIDGVCVLASSGPTQTSEASDKAAATNYTAFTGHLVTVLENGGGDASPLLLGELFRRTEKRMGRFNVGHQPLMATVGTAGNLVMRQASAPPPEPVPAPVPTPLAPTGSANLASGTQADAEPLPGLLSWLPDGTILVHDAGYADRIIGMRARSVPPPAHDDTPTETDTSQEGKHDGH
ncbi:caspase domain-containing protein [Streptomyces sp. uw30]|uniref:caspase family protein n=1 Tax=Streptomyces sp. uw30 TaxID=1828179 RepID=UPI0016513B92|nr:caspase family protein [Streptomyces sp. uw30]